MRHFTAKKFKLTFGMKPGKFFDLKKHVTGQHKVELMMNPTVAVVRAEFGTAVLQHQEKPMKLAYMLKVRWWLGDDGNLKGVIDDVCFFDSQSEMDEYKAEYAKMEKPLNQN